MIIISLLLVISVPLLLGLFVLSLFSLKDYLAAYEKLALSFSLGLGLLTILMFLLAVLRVPLTFTNILVTVFLILLTIALWLLFRKKEFIISGREFRWQNDFNWIEGLLFGLIGLKVVYAFFIALVKPVIDIDAITQYSLVAKGIFFQKTFFDPYFLGGLSDKPFFPYLSQAWVLLGINSFNDCLIKILTPILFLCFLVIFYSVLRRYFSRISSLFFVFLLSSLPFLVFHVATAYADFPQTFYYAVSTIYLFVFMKEFVRRNKKNTWHNLVLAFLFLAVSVWVKRAGMFIAGVNITVFISFILFYRKMFAKSDWKFFVHFASVFLLLILPWIIYSQLSLVIDVFKTVLAGLTGSGGTGHEIVDTGTSLLGSTGLVFNTLMKKIFVYADWHLLWAMFLLAILFGLPRVFTAPLIFLLVIIVFNLASLFLQFRFGSSFKYILEGTLLDRLIMNQVPIVLYFCAEVFLSLFEKNKTLE